MKYKVESGVDCATNSWLQMTIIASRIIEKFFFAFDFKLLRNYLIITSIKNKHFRWSYKIQKQTDDNFNSKWFPSLGRVPNSANR
jgi:hypothetical protein